MSQPLGIANVKSGDVSASAEVYFDFLVSLPDRLNLKMTDGQVFVRDGHHFGLSKQVYPLTGPKEVRKDLSAKLAAEIVRIRQEVATALSAPPMSA